MVQLTPFKEQCERLSQVESLTIRDGKSGGNLLPRVPVHFVYSPCPIFYIGAEKKTRRDGLATSHLVSSIWRCREAEDGVRSLPQK